MQVIYKNFIFCVYGSKQGQNILRSVEKRARPRLAHLRATIGGEAIPPPELAVLLWY